MLVKGTASLAQELGFTARYRARYKTCMREVCHSSVRKKEVYTVGGEMDTGQS